MKDIIISVKRQKTEIIWMAVCFLAAILVNVIAIIAYKTAWSEIYSQFLWILIIAAVLYAVSIAVRVLIYLLKRIF
ncbi:MAG: hypothetical protein LBR84_06180 [Tannerella sp.]|jgi:uncharacterized membrane protein YbhN (UPF0104 family)|nr:hypothetical protein [Tannerella sp.]